MPPKAATKAFVTRNIAPSPITEGVHELWYPRFAQTTPTFGVDENWRIIIRGSATAYSRRLSEDETAAAQPTYSSAPPLAAYRTYGKGRIVLFSSHSSWYTLNAYHYMWDEGLFLNEGDGRRFLQNVYRWLAEPTLKSGAFGGFRESEQKQLFDISPRLRENVQRQVTRRISGQRRQGIIGVHTCYSRGQHTVDEFCAEAKRLGLDFLVFTEDRNQWDAAKWQQLLADCRRNTDERFVAISGIRFHGLTSDNEGVVFNLRKPWSELPWGGKGFDTFIRLGVKNAWSANTGPWVALEDREIVVRSRVSADAPLQAANLYFGGRRLRWFRPGTNSFSAEVHFVTNESQALCLQVRDAEGRQAFSKALPGSRIRYHHFIGGDRMNGYWWPAEAASPEEATNKLAGKWARIFGSLYPGLGWGERIACVSPSQMSRPLGLETGPPDGGVRKIYVSPRLQTAEGIEFRTAAPHRRFPLNSTDGVIVEDQMNRELENGATFSY